MGDAFFDKSVKLLRWTRKSTRSNELVPFQLSQRCDPGADWLLRRRTNKSINGFPRAVTREPQTGCERGCFSLLLDPNSDRPVRKMIREPFDLLLRAITSRKDLGSPQVTDASNAVGIQLGYPAAAARIV